MFNNHCPACKAKDDEIKHLRALVDSVLIGKGLPPASPQGAPAREPIENVEVPEKIESDIRQYGGE